MASALIQKQAEFLADISRLIVWTQEAAPFEGDLVLLTAGHFYATTGHMEGSLHGLRLAADLNLFVNWQYIQGDHPHWHTLGRQWKSYHPDNRWGGDFSVRDYNHFSRTHGGKS